MISKLEFEKMISNLNTELYKAIEAELNEDDRKSLLALQRAVRERNKGYCYLEIGSHLGGSIQPHLLDPLCHKIYSIDKRPPIQPDDRGINFRYSGNTTARMLAQLSKLSSESLSKIVCFDCDARDVDATLIDEKPDICFIDGEHTSQAVVSDFNFCLSVIKPDGLICFHDSQIVWRGLSLIKAQLKSSKKPFKALKLGGTVSVVGLNDSVLDTNLDVKGIATRSWQYFILHQRIAHTQKTYFNHPAINSIKFGVKAVSNFLVRGH